ncbi:hypothetical protein EJ08DRAFT_703706 [Tothia fuscella]|uniref:Uncharacterized protein n=1 Tax=Tothia fuscella TaxID=1048955 RepID=A0A9P4NDS8_9PEZI|nr:hypothetical protein EJ08DRAFT_703706 [Tothia fuscella]
MDTQCQGTCLSGVKRGTSCTRRGRIYSSYSGASFCHFHAPKADRIVSDHDYNMNENYSEGIHPPSKEHANLQYIGKKYDPQQYDLTKIANQPNSSGDSSHGHKSTFYQAAQCAPRDSGCKHELLPPFQMTGDSGHDHKSTFYQAAQCAPRDSGCKHELLARLQTDPEGQRYAAQAQQASLRLLSALLDGNTRNAKPENVDRQPQSAVPRLMPQDLHENGTSLQVYATLEGSGDRAPALVAEGFAPQAAQESQSCSAPESIALEQPANRLPSLQPQAVLPPQDQSRYGRGGPRPRKVSPSPEPGRRAPQPMPSEKSRPIEEDLICQLMSKIAPLQSSALPLKTRRYECANEIFRLQLICTPISQETVTQIELPPFLGHSRRYRASSGASCSLPLGLLENRK